MAYVSNPFVPRKEQRKFPHHPVISVPEITELTGISRQGIHHRLNKEVPSFPPRIEDNHRKHRASYFHTADVYDWCEQRFNELIGNTHLSILKNQKKTVGRYSPTNKRVVDYYKQYEFLTSQPFTNHHWVGQLTVTHTKWYGEKLDTHISYLDFPDAVLLDREELIRFSSTLKRMLVNDELMLGVGNEGEIGYCFTFLDGLDKAVAGVEKP